MGEALFGNEQVSVVDRITQLKHGGPCSSHWTTLSASSIFRFSYVSTNLDVSLLAIPTAFSRLRMTDSFLHCCLDSAPVADKSTMARRDERRCEILILIRGLSVSGCVDPPAGEHGRRYARVHAVYCWAT